MSKYLSALIIIPTCLSSRTFYYKLLPGDQHKIKLKILFRFFLFFFFAIQFGFVYNPNDLIALNYIAIRVNSLKVLRWNYI